MWMPVPPDSDPPPSQDPLIGDAREYMTAASARVTRWFIPTGRRDWAWFAVYLVILIGAQVAGLGGWWAFLIAFGTCFLFQFAAELFSRWTRQ